MRHSHEAVWISLFKNVEAMAIGNGKATAAHGTYGTGPTGITACTILLGYLGVIDLGEALLKDVTNWRRKLPARMHFSVRKDCHEVKCRTTAIPGASFKEFDSPVVVDYVE